MKCANGKWKYGEGGNCVFDTLAACKAAAAAIHINDPAKDMTPVSPQITENPCVDSTHEDVTHEMQNQYK
jgi:hypothetical protein